jgi:hypothetical protein
VSAQDSSLQTMLRNAFARSPSTPEETQLKAVLERTTQHATNLGKQNHELRQRLIFYQQRAKNAERKIVSLEDEQEKMRTSMRDLQEHAFEQFESPHWKPDCNDDISHGLTSLDASVKQWARRHSVATMGVDGTEQTSMPNPKLKKVLTMFTRLDAETGLNAIGANKAWVLVQAFLMHSLYYSVFEVPFFGLDNPAADSTGVEVDQNADLDRAVRERPDRSSTFRESMQMLYDDFMACKITTAHIQSITD